MSSDDVAGLPVWFQQWEYDGEQRTGWIDFPGVKTTPYVAHPMTAAAHEKRREAVARAVKVEYDKLPVDRYPYEQVVADAVLTTLGLLTDDADGTTKGDG